MFEVNWFRRLAGVLVVVGLLAAGSAQTDPVVVFVRSGVEADATRAVAEAYTASTGRPIEIMEAGRSGYYAALHTQLVGGTTAFDLAQANDVDVGALAVAGAIAPIESFIFDPAATDLEAYDLDDFPFVYRHGGQIYAVPFDVSTHFLYYRSDLIESPPQTWDEYLETARRWTRSINPDSPTQYGAAFTALAGSEQPKAYYTIMWSMGGWIIDEDGEVGLDSPGAIEAARFLRTLVEERLVPPDVFSWGFSNVYEALMAGTVAMAAPYWNAAYPMIDAADGAFDIDITLVPGVEQPDGTIYRTPFQQGKIFVMNANSQRKEAAWDFYQFLTSVEGGRIMAEAGGTPSRLSLMADPSVEPREYYELMQESLVIARGDPGPSFYLEQHEAMNEALSQVITGSGPVEAQLQRAAATVRRLLMEYGE
jgi:multiple sugar transport system substrate-binding protein